MTPLLTVTTSAARGAAASATTAAANTGVETNQPVIPVMDRVVSRPDFWQFFQVRFRASHPVQRLTGTAELKRAQASRWSTARAAMSSVGSRAKVGAVVGVLGVGALTLSGEQGLLFAEANLGSETAYTELMTPRIAAAEAAAIAQKVQASYASWNKSDFSNKHAVAQLKDSDPELYAAILQAIVDDTSLTNYSGSERILPEQLFNLIQLDDPRLYPLFKMMILRTSHGAHDPIHGYRIDVGDMDNDWIHNVLIAIEYYLPRASASDRENIRITLRSIRDHAVAHDSLKEKANTLLTSAIDASYIKPE